MTPDVDLSSPLSRRPRPHQVLPALDRRLFEFVASRHWPFAEPVLPRLSRSANHGVLWFATAAAIAAAGPGPRARRAAVRGLASLALASLTVNTVGKRSVRRARPLLDPVPVVRRLKRQPVTTSFPSGHSASAAAFAAGVALESPGWGAAVAPLAGAVAVSRVYTGAHFPSDVLVGAALGVGAAYAVRGLLASRARTPAADFGEAMEHSRRPTTPSREHAADPPADTTPSRTAPARSREAADSRDAEEDARQPTTPSQEHAADPPADTTPSRDAAAHAREAIAGPRADTADPRADTVGSPQPAASPHAPPAAGRPAPRPAVTRPDRPAQARAGRPSGPAHDTDPAPGTAPADPPGGPARRHPGQTSE